jgi:hypothetical protein
MTTEAPPPNPSISHTGIDMNVPFLPDEDYIDDLNRHAGHIAACHFSLYAPDVADGRWSSRTILPHELMERLSRCRIPRKYVLFNARFQDGGRYMTPSYLQDLMGRLEKMLGRDTLTGIVFADTYWLHALSDAAPSVASELEAVPSVNFMIDSEDKAIAIMEAIGETRFKLPGKLPLDRALNRAPKRLATMAKAVKHYQANLKVELLVNEGCLYQCPYKLTHDSLIAQLNTGANVDTLALNRDLGCIRSLNRTPWRILASPFIRPEDVGSLPPDVDLIKICGRTLGPEFLKITVNAYLQGSYTGNLFDLLDACNWMARIIDLPNHRLPEDFAEKVTACSKNCGTCEACRAIWDQAATARSFMIPPMNKTSPNVVKK